MGRGLCVVLCVFACAPAAGHVLVVRAAPGGSVVARIGAQTIFGTPAALGVVERRGRWLGVTTDALPNGRIGWIDARSVRLSTVATSLRVQLSRRRLELLQGGRVVRSFAVGVGAPDSPTPVGRFAVAEKLDGPRYGAVWGCCILGLTAHQPHPPASWNQSRDYLVAIHGGGGIGSAVSAGCLHLDDASLRFLMRAVPVGAPVFITR